MLKLKNLDLDEFEKNSSEYDKEETTREAKKEIEDAGYSESLLRRYVTLDDLNDEDMFYISSNIKSDLEGAYVGYTQAISLGDFISDITPKAEQIRLHFDNSLTKVLACLISPVNKGSPNILKWKNGTIWSYIDTTVEHPKMPNTFIPVKLICPTPNYWGDNEIDEQRIFFGLDYQLSNCDFKPWHADYLNDDLKENHRKAMKILNEVVKVEETESKLLGICITTNEPRELTFEVITNGDQRIYKVII